MNAPPFPSNPSIGQWYGNWVWNGVRWVCGPSAGVRVMVQTFGASGPYMPSPGLVTAVVEVQGAGGGGAGALSSFDSAGGIAGWLLAGGGGGAGGYARAALAAALVAGGVQVTIGAGGAPGDQATEGQPGGATTFGALCAASGGSGGKYAAIGVANELGGGGAGGNGTIGDITAYGNSGTSGGVLYYDDGYAGGAVSGGMGGQSFFNGTVPQAIASPGYSANGAAGPDGGAGGNGGASGAITLPATGGAGAGGWCVVTEYCWADVSCEDDCLNPPINVNARVAVTNVPWPGPGPCPPGWGGGYEE